MNAKNGEERGDQERGGKATATEIETQTYRPESSPVPGNGGTGVGGVKGGGGV